jgi:hypothetical protein
LSNKAEDYSAIKSSSDKLHGWDDEDLTESGKIIFGSFRD